MKNDGFWSAKYYLAECNTTMSNQQTAAELQQLIDQLDKELKQLSAEEAAASSSARAAYAAAEAEVKRLTDAARASNFGDLSIPENSAAFRAARAAVTTYRNTTLLQAGQELSNATAAYTPRINAARSALRDAQSKLSVANAGPPNTNSTTPPTTANPPSAASTTTTEPLPQSPPLTQPRTADEEAFLAANTDPTPSNVSNIVDTGVSRDQAALLEANTGGDTPEPVSREQQAFLEANQADEGSLTAQPPDVDTLLDIYSQGSSSAPTSEENQRAVEEAIQQDETNAETRRLQNRGITKSLQDTRSSATRQDVENAKARKDWRVRISLASSANYFYRAEGEEGILYPLKATDGVIFPYTPTISITYSAAYDQQVLTHSNYKTTHYQASSVDNINISCDFTAQDTFEANYLLAVIHFFRSLTKMFYGQDENPTRGTPPPLCYLHGYGDFQFDKHPMAITGFTYQLPNDVDYIRTDTSSFVAGQPLFNNRKSKNYSPQAARGAPVEQTRSTARSPFKSTQVQPTYVPTRIAISISAIPVISRYDMSNVFSLKDYASGALLQGGKQKWGGFW